MKKISFKSIVAMAFITSIILFSYANVYAETLTLSCNNGYVLVNDQRVLNGTLTFATNEKVTLTTRPNTGYSFKNWQGDITGSRLMHEIVMDEDKSITATFKTWEPPIGIPVPEFGIFESYRMYDEVAKRNPALTYTENAEGGFYTHYVDNSDPNATNSSNPYGTAAKPRTSIPRDTNVPAGSVIEVHAGATVLGQNIFTVIGTKDQPIFLRGYSADDKPSITTGNLQINSQYIIVENIKKIGSGIVVRSFDSDINPEFIIAHHVAIRNFEVTKTSAGMSAVSYHEGIFASDVVFYNNHIHLDNFDPANGTFPEDDETGVYFNRGSNRVWVLDNLITRVKGDAVGGGHGANYTASNYYIGRNIINTCGENAIDIKEVDTVVLSQNIMYNFKGWSDGSDGTGIVVHYGPRYSPKNVWFLYNEIFDCSDNAIQVGGDQVYDVYFIGNIIHDIHNAAAGTQAYAYRTWSSRKVFLIGNVFYNLDNGIRSRVEGAGGELFMYNNIISNISTAGYHMDIGGSDHMAHSFFENNLFFQPQGNARINWAENIYDVEQFIANTDKGAGCIEGDPLFVDAENLDFRLQTNSPAIDAGMEHSVYQLFETRFGINIKVDFAGTTRPQGTAWDIGAYEYTNSNTPPQPPTGLKILK